MTETPRLEPIERQIFDTAELMRVHPPVWRDRNKQVVAEVSCPPGASHRGRLVHTRWRQAPLPEALDPAAAARRIAGHPGFYDYAPAADLPGAVEWHVNFADPSLFAYYSSGLFAQDEMQVAEHPALGALREALLAQGRPAVTVEAGAATPVLVMGVERRCAVATGADPDAGRPHGLYGNAFARADPAVVRRAASPVEPPTITNLIAMAAPAGGHGRYTAPEIEDVLATAYTAFRAATIESARAHGADRPVAIHTGFWGCGAFGGNRVLMAALQALAAGMGGVHRLVFHTGFGDGDRALAAALRVLTDDLATGEAMPMGDVIAQLADLGFAWGVSDGN